MRRFDWLSLAYSQSAAVTSRTADQSATAPSTGGQSAAGAATSVEENLALVKWRAVTALAAAATAAAAAAAAAPVPAAVE